MRWTIGRKINFLTMSLLLASLAGTVMLAVREFNIVLTGVLRKSAFEVVDLLATRVQSDLQMLADRGRTLSDAAIRAERTNDDLKNFIENNLSLEKRTLGLSIYTEKQGKYLPSIEYVYSAERKNNEGTVISKPFNFKVLQELDQRFPLKLTEVGTGKERVDFSFGQLGDGTKIIRMVVPLVKKSNSNDFQRLMIMEINQEALAARFLDIENTTAHLIDKNGKILLSSSPNFPFGSDLQGRFQRSDQQKNNERGQLLFHDKAGTQRMGTYQEVGFGGLKVIVESSMETVQNTEMDTYRRALWLTCAFLFGGLMVGFFFSQTLTNPILALAGAAEKVKNGDFSIRLFARASKKGKGDEIQEFAETFNEMVTGLQERDHIKNTFSKFHSPEIAKKLLSGELKLGGERKNAIVFFSDVRSFTSMSEKMDPEALVQILNRYMTRMVRVILENGGVVDKYVGDAIMALWGVPLARPDDPERAVRACLGMRKALNELNEELASQRLPILRIGMGLNFGPLIAGNIGSEERMEYTVIGDTVNTASRIESLTKELGTDLLISQKVLDHVPGKFIVERAAETTVKGRKDPIVVYKVKGYIENGKPIIIETPFSHFPVDKESPLTLQRAKPVLPPPFRKKPITSPTQPEKIIDNGAPVEMPSVSFTMEVQELEVVNEDAETQDETKLVPPPNPFKKVA